MDQLAGAVAEGMKSAIGSRHQAADLLRKVAADGQAGCFPSDVTCEQLGRALHRICVNSQEADPLMEIIRAWRACERQERDDFWEQGLILRQRDALMKETGRKRPPFVE